jgi:UDP-2,4-diacetamido-2,4,6-trideoxy-beta-L-altropyranose hydrolase
MNVVFRCDASLLIGTGHVMRCLTLADALQERGAESHFICRQHNGHLIDLISQRGHKVTALPCRHETGVPNIEASFPAHADWLGVDWSVDATETLEAVTLQPVDWLIVDHYALDERWEKCVKPACKRLMVIDDLADRRHDCDLLLDQGLTHNEQHYMNITPADSIKLCGPAYALLRPEFSELRPKSLARRKKPHLKKLLIFMGGVDIDNATGQILTALNDIDLSRDLEVTIVVGPHAPWLEQLRLQTANISFDCRVLANVDNMAQLMFDADLAIGAAGSTTWERCSLGLPSIQVALAENQFETAVALAKQLAVNSYLSIDELIDNLPKYFQSLQENPELLCILSGRSSQICDGSGTVSVVNYLLTNTSIRKAHG